MAYVAKEDFLQYKKGEQIPDSEIEEYPNWKQHCEEKEVSLDITGDGKVDEKDVSLAAKIMGKSRKIKKRKKK